MAQTGQPAARRHHQLWASEAHCGRKGVPHDRENYQRCGRLRLAKMIRTGAGCVQDPLGVVHIYYDPEHFSILLHYLRTGRLLLRGHTSQEVLAAAEYWRLPGLAALCQGQMGSKRSSTDAPSVVADNAGKSLSEDKTQSDESVADASPAVKRGPLQAFNEGQQLTSDSTADAQDAFERGPHQTFNEAQQRSSDCAASASHIADQKLQQPEQASHVIKTYATVCDIDAHKAFRCEELELMLFLEAAEQEDVAVLHQKLRRHPSMRSLKEIGEPLDAPDADAKRSLSTANTLCHLSRAPEGCMNSVPVEKKEKRRSRGKSAMKRRKEAKKAARENIADQTSEQDGPGNCDL